MSSEQVASTTAAAGVAPKRRPLRAVLALLGAVALFAFAFERKAMNDLEALARDFDARTSAPQPSDSIVLVTITDSDYESMFSGRSPLDVDTLRRLLRGIAAGRPRVIAMDLETSHPSFRRLRPFADSLAHTVRLIWAQDAASCPSPEEETGEAGVTAPPHITCSGLHPVGVLGETKPDAAEPSGLAAVQLDAEGSARYYRRLLPTDDGRLQESFTWAVRRAYDASAPEIVGDTLTRFIAFHPSRAETWRIAAREVSALAALPDSGRKVLAGKAVLVGGTYSAARDEHYTPVGMLPGIEIQAQALATEFRGGGPHRPSALPLAVLQFLCGATVIVLLLHLSLGRAMLALILAVPVLSILGSWVVTGSPWAGVFYFVPLLTLVVLYELYEKANFYRELLIREVYHQARGLESAEESIGPFVARLDAALGSALSGARGLVVRGERASRKLLARRTHAKRRGSRPASRGSAGPVADRLLAEAHESADAAAVSTDLPAVVAPVDPPLDVRGAPQAEQKKTGAGLPLESGATEVSTPPTELANAEAQPGVAVSTRMPEAV